ncbi:MAG: putative Ig domain-containing protein [Myxococcaceae bacterium]|nr:putative Ig domain-containing protein [Myxococcaceae bacterium]
MKTTSLMIGVVAALAAQSALAQNYVVQQSPLAYQPLAGAGVQTATLVARSSSFDPEDEGYIDLPLGFTFNYYGTNYTSVHVDSNGFLMFETNPTATSTCHTGFACYSGSKIPSTTRTPHNVIAPWWGDHEGAPTSWPFGTTNPPTTTPVPGSIHYKQGSGEMEIEWSGWYKYSGYYAYTVKVKLTASGLFQVHYGPITSISSTTSGVTVGFEDSTGANGAAILTCSATSNACQSTNFPTDTLVTVGQPVQPDLVVTAVNVSNLVVLGDTNLSLTVAPTFKNFGQMPANNFFWKAYLSKDKLKDASDVLIYTSGSAISVAGMGAELTTSGNAATTTPPGPGQYFVLVEADTTNAVAEALETNNVGSTLNYFVNGLDLVATSVTGPANSGPGNSINLGIRFFNQGTNSAGTVGYRVLLSTDNVASSNDFVLYTDSRTVTGAETVDIMVPVVMPDNVPGGDFSYLLQVDPANAINEASETNNVVASTSKVTIRQADLANTQVDFVDAVTGASTRVGDFGQLGRARVSLSNTGGADAKNFKIGVVISSDQTLSLLNDTLIAQYAVPAPLTAGTMQTYDFTFNIPLKDRNAMNFATGNYFIFFLADVGGVVTELNEGNNNLSVGGTVRLRAPAADLVVTRVESPASAAVGEVIPVLRTFKNIGVLDAPAVKYRYVASANAIITPDDVPLTIVSGTMTANDGSVTLAVGAVDTQTELVRLPPTMAPGTYYLGAIIDTADAVVELDETNNALASNTVQVAASSLRVSTAQLPDAVVDRPYAFRLAAAGEQGASTWAIDATQGALPMGLTMANDGLISGTPTTAVVSTVTAVVTNGGRQAAARLVLRVLPTTSQVEITTTSVPPVINSAAQKYEFGLGAAGGVKPYVWTVVDGALPQNLALSTDGVISGNPRVGLPEGSSKVTVEVKDSLGSSARKELTMRVVAPGSIVFSTPSLPDGLVGASYQTDISVANMDGTMLMAPVSFVPAGSVPDGLNLSFQSGLALLEGKPTKAGTFVFSLTVTDGKGRSDTAEFTVRVYPARFSIKQTGLPDVIRPGEEANFSFSSTGVAPATFSVYSGSLPPGLTMSREGVVKGLVPADKSEGSYTFVIEGRDDSGATGLGVFAVDVRREVKTGGCSAAGNLGGLWILAGLLPLLLRRRARAALLAPAAIALLVAGTASAQDYSLDGPKPLTFRPLAAGTAVTNGQTVTLPFNFTFYGTTTNSVAISHYGYLSFSGSATYSSNQGIPNSSTSTFYPQTLIAPWWDSFISCTAPTCTVKYQTFDVAPRRYAVIEWGNVTPSSTAARFSFQAVLYEGTNQIRFAYGPTAPGTGSASVGIQKVPNTGIAALSCTTTTSGACTTGSFPTNSVIDFYLPPDAALASVTGDQTGYAGVTYRASALLRNRGGRSASNVVVRFFLSTDATLDGADVKIGDAMPVELGTVEDVLVTSGAPIPANTTPGNYFLIAKVDPDGTVLESDETNNVGTPFKFQVGSPTADLSVASITSPATGTPGGTIMPARTLLNGGNAAAAAFKYTWVISDNSVATISDPSIFVGSVAGGLTSNQTDTMTDSMTLPSSLGAGKYWLGVCVNYDPMAMPQFGIDEISRVNNCATAAQPIVISSGALTIATTSLPGAAQYSPYGLRLQALGGDGSYAWTLSGGALPQGMALSAQGDLAGNPAKAGAYSFEVKVSSAGAEKTQALSLQVAVANLPLAIVDQELPAAEFSRAYEAGLVAVGGKPPYVWSLKENSNLPAGLGLATDGTIEGRAAESGTFMFSVEVQDSAGVKAAKDLELSVVTPGSLHIATTGLARGSLLHSYLQPLQAVGGKPGYDWFLVKFQQLAESPTDAPGPVITTFDDKTNLTTLTGLAIEDGGNGLDYLRGTPKKAGAYVLTLKVVDGNGSEDTAQYLLQIAYDEAVAITTTALPDAFSGRNYQARLSHNLPAAEATNLVFALTCVKQVVHPGEFACAPTSETETLPAGITLAADGTLSGQTTAAPGVYSFLVELRDEQGRRDVRGLAIRVRENYTDTKSGCSALALGPSLLAALAASALLRRRRGR